MRSTFLVSSLVFFAACGKESENGKEPANTDGAGAGTSGTSAFGGTDGNASGGSKANASSGGTSPTSAGAAGTMSTGGTTGGTGNSSGGSHNGGSKSGGGTSAGTDGSTQREPWGEIVFGSVLATGASLMGQTFAYARFYPSSQGSPQCVSYEYEHCTFWSCVPDHIDKTGGPADAGAITIISQDNEFSQTLFADSLGHYGSVSLSTVEFLGEEQVRIDARGDEIGAFKVDQQFPLVLLLTQPALPAGADYLEVARSADAELRWDRGKAGVFWTLQSSDTVYPRVYCSLPSELGAFTLPAALLSRLSEGNELDLFTIAETTVKSGDYTIYARAAASVMTPDRMHRVNLKLR